MSNPTNDLVHIENLKFSYTSNGPVILDIPRFNMKNGEKIFLFGPSGSGKTTFLEIVSGILKPTAGIVSVGGCRLDQMNNSQRDVLRAQRMGYIFQSFNLIPYLSAEENIWLPFRLYPSHFEFNDRTSTQKFFQEMSARLGIENFKHKLVTELSIGQQQRVAVARALLTRPQLLLADEPTSALDQDHREKFLKLIFDISKSFSLSVLFVSHDQSLKSLFDRAVRLDEINQVRASLEVFG